MLPIAVLVLATTVGIAGLLSTFQLFPQRSLGSLLVGTIILVASFAELFLVPLLLYRFATSKYTKPKRILLYLLAGIVAGIPAFRTIVVAFLA